MPPLEGTRLEREKGVGEGEKSRRQGRQYEEEGDVVKMNKKGMDVLKYTQHCAYSLYTLYTFR